MQAAEAKAYYGLTHNYSALQALVEALLDKGSLTGAEVREAMAAAGSQPFKKPYLEGFGWGRDHHLTYPGKVLACPVWLLTPPYTLCMCLMRDAAMEHANRIFHL